MIVGLDNRGLKNLILELEVLDGKRKQLAVHLPVICQLNKIKAT